MLFCLVLFTGVLTAMTAFSITMGAMLVDALMIDLVDASSDLQRKATLGLIVGASIPIAIIETALILLVIDKRLSGNEPHSHDR